MFKSICASCGKNKWFVRYRSYMAKGVSPKPIASKGKLCGSCHRRMKKIIK